jgi:hypothetical protein
MSNTGTDASRRLFNVEGILEQVLGYVGPGHWLFIAEVSKLWQQTYKMVAVVHTPEAQKCLFESGLFRCHAQMTLGQAVFASESRLAWAHHAELRPWRMGYVAGFFADENMLALARELYSGLHKSDAMLLGAAASGSTIKMNWLYAQRQLEPLPRGLLCYAASSGSLDMLQLIQSDHALNTEGKLAMRVAAHRGYVHICKHLREAGCAWDTIACSCAVSACQLDTLRWLHENGCPWVFRSLC